MGKFVMGMLCHSRPIHTALTLGYVFANKSDNTDFHAFYGVPEDGEHKSPSLLNMLNPLESSGYLTLHYLPEKFPKNTGGNVDNLMYTLHGLEGYDCYFKIDDDVLIGPSTDEKLARFLLDPALEESKVLMLAGQAVRQHMQGPGAFGWDMKIGDTTFVTRRNGMSPMETFVAVSYHMLPHLKRAGYRTGCENAPGTFGPYSKKLFLSGAKAALVLYPNICMQHIGLTCTTGDSDTVVGRAWAPATHWTPAGKTIEVPHFNFPEWESAHIAKTQKQFALEVLSKLHQSTMTFTDTAGNQAIQTVIHGLEKYEPGVGDVDLPAGKPAGRFARRNIARQRTLMRPVRGRR